MPRRVSVGRHLGLCVLNEINGAYYGAKHNKDLNCNKLFNKIKNIQIETLIQNSRDISVLMVIILRLEKIPHFLVRIYLKYCECKHSVITLCKTTFQLHHLFYAYSLRFFFVYWDFSVVTH